MFVYFHVVIFAETMDRDLQQEELLGDIIRDGGDPLSFLNDTDDPTMEEEGDDDGSGDRMAEEEGDHDDGSGDRTEEAAVAKSGEVYILIKPVLTN
jgi:hypothetical protein